MKLGRIGPWPQMEVLNGPFIFWATRGPSLFCNQTIKLVVLGNKMDNVGLILVGIGPWPYLEALSGPFELCHQETKS